MKLLVFSNTAMCAPCRMMEPIVNAVVKERGIEMIKGTPEQYGSYGITGIPTYILLDDENKEVRRVVGATPKPQFEKFLED